MYSGTKGDILAISSRISRISSCNNLCKSWLIGGVADTMLLSAVLIISFGLLIVVIGLVYSKINKFVELEV